jgi:hypothetical protein
MPNKSAKTLPKTTFGIENGGVYQQRVKCGKPNCKCLRGEKHVAYYFFTRRNGKLTKTYVRKSELEKFTQLVDEATTKRKEERRTRLSDQELLKRLRQALRDRETFINSMKG